MVEILKSNRRLFLLRQTKFRLGDCLISQDSVLTSRISIARIDKTEQRESSRQNLALEVLIGCFSVSHTMAGSATVFKTFPSTYEVFSALKFSSTQSPSRVPVVGERACRCTLIDTCTQSRLRIEWHLLEARFEGALCRF